MALNRGVSLFRRYEGNPILTPRNWPYPANSVFNPGAAQVDGETLLLVRVEDMRGFSHLTVARSWDGRTNWVVDPEPALEPEPNIREEQWGLEDPRIVFLEDEGKYAVTYVSFSQGGPLISLALTEDFRRFERRGPLLPPEDKDASLFPKRFGGRFALIHRPIIRGEAHIWISFSPDLKYWGEHRVLLPVRAGWWDCHKVGLGPQPMETSEGWLVIYHGVRRTASGNLYRLGLALLDLEDPCKVIRRSQEWVFSPKEDYELIGDVPGVVFPCGAVADEEKNELRMYYGAADTFVALAVADMDEVIDYIMHCPS
ncbi:MAG: glycosidase [Candidatus Latescibacterota bacterium]|nr:MAG: glycosidase [Candidatus Latescibacterota bacterium]